MGLSALILGATGATGKQLLQELLASPQYSSVAEYGRRVTSSELITSGKDKLEQKTIDFEKLEESGLKDKKWDVVFITLGTTRNKAGSAASFERIDREYVINAARAAKSDDPSHRQKLLYVSSGGANPSSYALYMRSKGLTELGLAELGYSDTIIFRPALLGAERGESRPLETIAQTLIRGLSAISSRIYMPVTTLAKSMRIAGEAGTTGLPPATVHKAGGANAPFTLADNSSILTIANAFA
ncbi:hypothetical protein WOLCODRAFT_139070 [Wolfiporia cocos MD-104 SS10]|uniref:NAD-dependent epimerase/dehydratase domain-containing protein n=1 Tax=Wolfiporia cocos (strain MD-104) TaxID=742152 RepID=A0A2H3JSS9_WOLCO|nr:hypothetical protein WOLCODRAFT_139070 [Wolfiporia cocos MD-104 SS10]